MDLTSVKTIRDIQRRFGFSFKKGYGQNFLTSKSALEEIVKAARESGAEGVIEIGPGFGVLTRALAESFDKVVAVELDESLLDVLDYTLGEFDNVKVINADALKIDLSELIQNEFDGKDVSVAANLPYYAATQIIISLLDKKLPLKSMIVMVQKEVAERVCAAPSTKSYGALSVICQYYAAAEVVTEVTADMFVPPPKVDSAVVRLDVPEKPSVAVSDEEMFFNTVKAAFSQRRKTLLNCLGAFFGLDKAVLAEKMNALGIDPRRRGETLSLEEFARLSDMLGEL
ncbi:MAG: 16S rRNA (adenine(1518)-N(6)/adenine(1519)-N(6))-dimethyltransferase RsmA [Firmicutes bacterium]|nr:16S rRNA (adenine(1518)-N(6)/adenine(1519)-N(6))-dimethyltransferase RsmA [Bacillota bacterium]